MKAGFLFAFLCAAISCMAQDRSSSVAYTSAVVTNRAWSRDVVARREPTGEILSDSGTVGDAAQAAAAGAIADAAAEMADEARISMTNRIRMLDDAASSASTNSLAIALVVRPETDRTNITFYVVKTETDGVVDTQYVWCNRDVSLAPRRFVVYRTFGMCSTNRFEWADWSQKTNVTVFGRTWNGCRVGTVSRPTWARYWSCLDNPNDTLGGQDGFDFGDVTVTVSGRTPYTGFVTNNVTGEVLYFDNGFNKGNPEE